MMGRLAEEERLAKEAEEAATHAEEERLAKGAEEAAYEDFKALVRDEAESQAAMAKSPWWFHDAVIEVSADYFGVAMWKIALLIGQCARGEHSTGNEAEVRF